MKYTPLEKQYLDVHTKHPDLVLLVENGYKYNFFGKDAEVIRSIWFLLFSVEINWYDICRSPQKFWLCTTDGARISCRRVSPPFAYRSTSLGHSPSFSLCCNYAKTVRFKSLSGGREGCSRQKIELLLIIEWNNLTYGLDRLVQAGYKVGIVSQTETRALKKIGENKSAVFTRITIPYLCCSCLFLILCH